MNEKEIEVFAETFILCVETLHKSKWDVSMVIKNKKSWKEYDVSINEVK